MASNYHQIAIPKNISDDTILYCIETVANMKLSPNDLKNPTSEMVTTIYNSFACNILNVSVEQITQVPLHILETISNPDLITEEAIGPLMCMKALELLFRLCGVGDFCMADLREPSKKRTRKLLSALTNFYQFYVQNEKDKNDVLSKLEHLSKGIEVYTDKRRMLKERITQLKAERMEKQKAVQEMNLSALRGRQEEVAAYKEQNIQKNKKIMQEADELQCLVTVTKSSRLIKQAQEILEERISRENALRIKENTFTKFGDIAPSALKTVQNIKEDLNRLSINHKRKEEITDLSMDLKREAKDVAAQIEIKRKLIESKEESLARLDNKLDNKVEEEKENMEKFKQKKLQVQKNIAETQDLLDATRLELKAETEKELLQKETHSKNMKVYDEQFKSIKDKAEKFEKYVDNNCNKLDQKFGQLRN